MIIYAIYAQLSTRQHLDISLQRFTITCKLHQPHVNVLEEWLIYMQKAQEIDP